MTPYALIVYPGVLGAALLIIGATALAVSWAMGVVSRRKERERLTDLMMARGFRVADKHGWIREGEWR